MLRAWTNKTFSPQCFVAAFLLLAMGSAASSVADGALADMEAKALYGRRCGGCHSLDRNRVGPRHANIIGRQAGTVPGYAYSRALQQSKIVWDADTLNKWLTNPEALVPGQKMGYRLGNAQERLEIIAFLGTKIE